MKRNYDVTLTMTSGKYGMSVLIIRWRNDTKAGMALKLSKRYHVTDESAQRLAYLFNCFGKRSPYISAGENSVTVAKTFMADYYG